MDTTFTFATCTASLVIYDEAVLSYRADDDDWWSLPSEEMKEVNDGNLVSIALGTDGVYTVQVSDHSLEQTNAGVQALVRAPGGTLAVGAGEILPGMAGTGPKHPYGERMNVKPGTVLVTVNRVGPFTLAVSLLSSEMEARNKIDWPLSLPAGSVEPR